MLSVACNIKPKMGLKVCSFVYVGFGDMAVSFSRKEKYSTILSSEDRNFNPFLGNYL